MAAEIGLTILSKIQPMCYLLAHELEVEGRLACSNVCKQSIYFINAKCSYLLKALIFFWLHWVLLLHVGLLQLH